MNRFIIARCKVAIREGQLVYANDLYLMQRPPYPWWARLAIRYRWFVRKVRHFVRRRSA